MEESSPAPSPRELGKSNEARLSKLRRILKETPGFAFLTVTVEAGVMRAEVVRRLAVWSGLDGVPEMRVVSADRQEPLSELAAGAGLVLIEPDDATSSAQIELAQRLNWQRDGMLRAVAGPLVVVVSRAGHQALFEQAPDLYSWRRHSVAINPELPALAVHDLPRPDDQRKAERVRLQETFAELSHQGVLPLLAQAELRVRIAALMVREGLGAQAEALLQESLETFHQMGDSIGEMMTLLGIAEAAWAQNDRERAAKLLQESATRRQVLGPSIAEDASLGRFGMAGLAASVRFAVLSAYLRLDDEPMQVLEALERVENHRCDKDVKAEILLLQAAALQRIEDADAAAVKLRQASALYDELGDGTGQIRSLTALSMLLRSQGRAEEALEVARDLKKQTASWPEFDRAVADASIVAALHDIASEDQAFSEAHDQMKPEVARAVSPIVAVLAARKALAGVHNEGTIEKLREAESALISVPGAESRDARMSLIRHRAEIEFSLGRVEAAASTAESLEELAQSDRRTERGRARLLRAAIALGQRTYEEGLELFRDAAADLLNGDDVASLAAARLGQGWALLELGRPAESIEEIELSLQAFLDLGRLEEAQRPADLLVQAHAALHSSAEE